MKFNGDIVFVDTSGQVRARSGDLTLRADDTGLKDIIVGSGRALRPEVSSIALGLSYLPWNHIYVRGGSFTSRPTVSGSGVLLQGEQGVFGDYRQDAASDGLSTNSTSTYQTKVTMTTPALPAGRYRVGWSAEYSSSRADRSVELRVTVGGSTVSSPGPDVGHGQDVFYPYAGHTYVNLSGIVTVNLDFATVAGGGPSYSANTRRARIELWRVG